jgi:CBS domain containing-hemolysin-like protein
MSEAGELLDEGQSVAFNGHNFVIEKVDRRRIVRVRMETAPETASQ